MKKFDIAYVETRRIVIAIEANDEQEAKDLFTQKMQDDDEFLKEVEEYLKNGVIDEEIYAYPLDDGDVVDYTYEEMKESGDE